MPLEVLPTYAAEALAHIERLAGLTSPVAVIAARAGYRGTPATENCRGDHYDAVCRLTIRSLSWPHFSALPSQQAATCVWTQQATGTSSHATESRRRNHAYPEPSTPSGATRIKLLAGVLRLPQDARDASKMAVILTRRTNGHNPPNPHRLVAVDWGYGCCESSSGDLAVVDRSGLSRHRFLKDCRVKRTAAAVGLRSRQVGLLGRKRVQERVLLTA